MNYVIMCGGSGTRLWPRSRFTQPKQFAQLVTELTMLEETVKRLDGLATPANTYISTIGPFAPVVHRLLPKVPKDHYIIEPERRDTGPAMAFVAAWMSRVGADEPMILMPADHHIKNPAMYRATFSVGEALVRELGVMVNIGLPPTFPNTNLGYLKVGEELETRGGVHVFAFEGQREKPDAKTAKQFLAEGNYLWNGGYFLWTPQRFMDAYERFAPSIGRQLPAIIDALEKKNEDALHAAFARMEAKSIDYAVIEKMDSSEVRTVRGDFGWADLGDWHMLSEQLAEQADEHGNLVKAHWRGIDTQNTLVYGPPEKLIATIGVSGLVIVDTPDALLVTPKERSQEVKKVVELLTNEGLRQYL
ncbi:mannose-1-phosphate guanylyltransferase [Candidatus Berkelbacteria bacterium]|nr:mannose-1-phosphate guanylyltransferase [Candidatus Berkelbacteria bacterium]